LYMPENSIPYLSVIIPANNEEGSICETCEAIVEEFAHHGIEDYEILIINDNSTDDTETLIIGLCKNYAR